MDSTKSGIAILDRVHHDPDCQQVINLAELLVLGHHLTINRVNVFRPPIDLHVRAKVKVADGLLD